MKTLVSFFAIFLFSSGLFAQKFIQKWYIELPGLGTHASATAILATQDNQLLIAGPSRSNSSVGSTFYIKTDTSGTVTQSTFSDEQFFDTSQKAHKLIEDQDNNFVMTGSYSYHNSTYFTKLSQDGTIINTSIDGGQYNYQGGYDVIQTTDSGYLVSAQKEIYGVGMAIALRKLDVSGNFIWDTTLVHPADSTPIIGNFYRIAKIDDSTIVISGKCHFAPGSTEGLDVLLAKVRVWDDSIKLLNFKIFQQDGTDEQGYDILVLPDYQGYVICGIGANEANESFTDGIIIRTDTACNLVWKKSYTRTSLTSTIFLRMQLDSDENILVLARTQAGSSDVSLLKYSLQGNLLQKMDFDFGVNEIANDFALSQEGEIYVATGTYSLSAPKALLLKVKDICPVAHPEALLIDTILNPGDDVLVTVNNTNDAWEYKLIQINGESILGTTMGNGGTYDFTIASLTNSDVSEGLVVSVTEPGVDCVKYSDTLKVEFIDGIQIQHQNALAVNPNPFHDFIRINTKEGNQLSGIAVYTVNGQLVFKETASSNNRTVNLSQLPKGIYLLKASYQSGASVFKKLVKN